MQALLNFAASQKADIITTTKDFVKIPTAMQDKFKVLEIKMQWENPEELKDFILSHIGKK